MKKPNCTPSIWTEKALLKRLARSPEARAKFVESQIRNGISGQIRAQRNRRHWSQPELARKIETSQNQIYRLENPATAKPTISTLKKLAAVFDVALVVRFVPFSQAIAWASGTSFLDRGLSTGSLVVPNFAEDRSLGPNKDTLSQREQVLTAAEEPHQVAASGKVPGTNSSMRHESLPDQTEQAKSQQTPSAANSDTIPGAVIDANQQGPRMFAAGAGGH